MIEAPEREVGIPPGTVVLDKYRVVAQIGVGGMGLVVQATHAALGTSVAIKFLLPQFAASTDAGRRFVNEAKAASKIASEHIVRVFDAGTSQPYGPFIVMEYLHGHDLSRHLRDSGACSIEAALDFTVQAALALSEAHAHGIVHRDVKPANLFLVEQPDGTQLLKVLDFGISKVVEASALDVTKTTAILGSGLYMSPEQMKSSKTVDHRTDVYALGVSLFELLTCTQPFTAESFAELAIKVNMEPPDDIRVHRPEISAGLAEVIARAYAKKADQRYQSMGELALALEPWCAERTRARVEALVRTETRRGRAPAPATTAGGVSAAGALGTTAHASSSPLPPGTPALSGSQLKFPRPPSLPSASSLGLDTFGVSSKDQSPGESLGVTDDPALIPKNDANIMLGVGLGTGAILALALAAYLFVSAAPAPVSSSAGPSSAAVVASADAHQSVVVVAPQGAVSPSGSLVTVPPAGSLPAVSSARSGPRSATASAAEAASGAPVSTSTAASSSGVGAAVSVPLVPQVEVAPPPPVAPAPKPCGMRELDGTLRACPKN